MLKKRKLSLGSGNNPDPDSVNIDILPLKGIDIIHNLESFPYPFSDDEFDVISANHVLEHIENIIGLMREAQRISSRGAEFHIIVPYFSNPSFWLDVTHRRKYSYETFSCFDGHYYHPDILWRVKKRKLMFFSNKGFMRSRFFPLDFLINLCPKLYERFFSYIFPCSELHVILENRKDVITAL